MSPDQVYASRAEMAAGPGGPLRAKQLVPIAVVVAASALAFGSTIVSLYFANGLDAVPLSEVASGAYDPKDLPFSLSAERQLLGYAAILVTPFAAVLGIIFTGVDLAESLRSRRPRRAVLPGAAVLVLCLVVLAGYTVCGPLITWWMD